MEIRAYRAQYLLIEGKVYWDNGPTPNYINADVNYRDQNGKKIFVNSWEDINPNFIWGIEDQNKNKIKYILKKIFRIIH